MGTQLRWGDNVPDDAAAARERLLDAAETCFARFGVPKTTLDDVAAEASTSRATVYRYFAGRDELIVGVLLRDHRRFLQNLKVRLEAQPTFAEMLVECVLASVEAARVDTRVRMLFVPETRRMTEEVAGASDEILKGFAEFLRPYVQWAKATGRLQAGIDLRTLSEWVTRVVFSFISFPGPERSLKEQRRLLLNVFAPALATDNPTRR